MIQDVIKTLQKTSKIKTTNISEWKSILKNEIVKILKIAQPRKLRTLKIYTYGKFLVAC